MKTVLFILSASVKNNKPTEWFQQRIDEAIKYYYDHSSDDITFLVSGRWNNVTDIIELTEAEVAKRYILHNLPSAKVLIEDIAVDTAGNFAFSKPIIMSIDPDNIVIFGSKVFGDRIKYLASKILGDPDFNLEYVFVNDTLSKNERAIKKEPKALKMFQELFADVEDGNDQLIRDILLYKTPFYYKGFIDDKKFFDQYWEGGFNDFLEKNLSINNK